MKSTRSAPRTRVCSVTLTALATVSLAVMLSPVLAADPATGYEPVSQLVQYSDLNLNSQQGIAQLYQRIDSAARDVCGDDSRTRSLADWSQARSCAKGSISRAVAKIDNAALTAFYTHKIGRLIEHKALLSRR